MFADIIVDIAHSAIDKVFTYHVPEALSVEVGHHVLIPFGRGDSPKEGFVLNLRENCDFGKCKDVIRLIEPYPVLLPSQIELCRWMQKTYRCLAVDALRLMIPTVLRGGKAREKSERVIKIKEGLDLDAALKRTRSPVQRDILNFLFETGVEISVKDLAAFFPNASAAISAIIKKGFATTNSYEVFRRPDFAAAKLPPHTPTPAQASVTHTVCESQNGAPATFLLHGVTGSGKTEVYLDCIAHCLSMGKRAIVLVPEIALTPQTVGRFRQRFGDDIAVLHSRLSNGERFDEWRRIRLGLAKIVIGARSAIFAPVDKLGLIVIDEEHESSYQSESAPRYHAVEIAQRRSKEEGCTLLLGSATPSLLSYYRAKSGTYRLLELPDRVLNRPLPLVKIVDMREEFLNGNTGILSFALLQELRSCLERGQQAMLFINRRGYSTFVSCRACGYVQKCTNCDVSLTYHKSAQRMKCHYCGYSAELPKVCPNCHKPFLKQFGIGTEQVEEAVKAAFPGVNCLRLDTDTTARKGELARILSAFTDNKAQVLIGTQMIAKGHDFPLVTLVGVVCADTTLNLPDFRSRERTFQLLTQVAGRAGRDSAKGKVVIQTYSPAHPVISFARAHDYAGFYNYEILERRKCLYPPFSIFVRLLFSGEDEQRMNEFCSSFARLLEEALLEDERGAPAPRLLLLSAAPAPVARILGRFRYQIVLKLLRTKDVASSLSIIYKLCGEKCGDLPPNIEINPQDMF
ncbi:MAG: primosomal protein N' [Clostridia bacterium]|nr:primosomal protein N' [Clostridia bacterium]